MKDLVNPFASNLILLITHRDVFFLYQSHKTSPIKAGAPLSCHPIIDDDPIYVLVEGWAEMIRKVYEEDPLLVMFSRIS